MKFVPGSLPGNLRELVVNVKGYVAGPFAHERGRMLAMLSTMKTMLNYVPKLKLIAFMGWVLDYKEDEKEWREGKMSEEEYCQEVVEEMRLWNNASKSTSYFFSCNLEFEE